MFEYFEVARGGSWLGWIFNFGFGSVLFGVACATEFNSIPCFTVAEATIFSILIIGSTFGI
jgi:hypothetical protein